MARTSARNTRLEFYFVIIQFLGKFYFLKLSFS